MSNLNEIPDFLKRSGAPVFVPDNKPVKLVVNSAVQKVEPEESELELELKPKRVVDVEKQNLLLSWALKSEIEDIIFRTFDGTDDLKSINRVVKLSNAKPKVIRMVYNLVEELINEFNEIGVDEQVSEAYEWLGGKRQVNKLQNLGRDALIQIRLLLSGKRVRIQKKRSISVEKVVGSMKYQKDDPDLGLVSIDPSQIVGARKLVVYDTKRRQAGVYSASEGSTLNVKGTTIQNFDPERSFVKRLRNPGELLVKLTESHEKRVDVLLDEVQAKRQSVNGRTRSEVILLKVFK